MTYIDLYCYKHLICVCFFVQNIVYFFLLLCIFHYLESACEHLVKWLFSNANDINNESPEINFYSLFHGISHAFFVGREFWKKLTFIGHAELNRLANAGDGGTIW
jgi:hypothetical protein